MINIRIFARYGNDGIYEDIGPRFNELNDKFWIAQQEFNRYPNKNPLPPRGEDMDEGDDDEGARQLVRARPPLPEVSSSDSDSLYDGRSETPYVPGLSDSRVRK